MPSYALLDTVAHACFDSHRSKNAAARHSSSIRRPPRQYAEYLGARRSAEIFDTFKGSKVTIADCTVRDHFHARSDSLVKLPGEPAGNDLEAGRGSSLNISGCSIGNEF